MTSSALGVVHMERRRLVDYIVVAGYDHRRGKKRISASEGDAGGANGGGKGETDSVEPVQSQADGAFHCQGTILQRFPRTDWKDTPFIDGLEHFCQPNGWFLSAERSEPKFFIAVLTDIHGSRHYCAVLSFSEAVAKEDLAAANEDEENDDATELTGAVSLKSRRGTSLPRHMVPGVSLPALAHDALMFAPKCLVLVSRHDHPELLKNCLGIVYTAYSECLVGVGGERIRLETLIGNLLGSIFVPPSGGPQIRFSLGAMDKMTLQPPLYSTVPSTGNSVALLFKQLGIRNVLTLFCAAMTELKILFYSQSFNRLTDACMALIALMYPMRYSHVFIPILPSSLLEVLSTPTPFIIGVHSIHEHEIVDLLDIVVVDLDGGALTVPENMTINKLPSPMMLKVQRELSLVLHPELSVADNAFASPGSTTLNKKPLPSLDKELRAVMLRLMVQLLEGYRSCLMLVRIHPKPYITFHKAAFLGLRNLCSSEFARRLLDCMFFNTFVSERGPPWRETDIFDEVYASYAEKTALEDQDQSKVLINIQMLAEQFFRNENPITTLSQPYAQKIPQPAEGAMSRIHQPVFPVLEDDLVTDIIDQGLDRFRKEFSSLSLPTKCLKSVPSSSKLSRWNTDDTSGLNNTTLQPQSARKLGVLRNCINSIFENKIADAKKTFPAVISALKSRNARTALCEELAAHQNGSKMLLEHQQFDMIVRLMNSALQDDSDLDEYGIALAILPLSTHFGRNLSKGVDQFAYTLIQDHAVWQNLQFWEASFYNEVQNGIKSLYVNLQDQNTNNNDDRSHSSNTLVTSQKRDDRISVLELAANEMKNWEQYDEASKKERINAEENTVYSQAFVYINYMVSLMCPLDLAATRRNGKRMDDFENASNSISNSMAESDSIDAESGFEDQEIPDSGQHVIKNLVRFIDKVCSEGGVTEDHIKSLSNVIPTSVALHLEQLEAVSNQANRLPPIHKPKILTPSLLPGEELITPNGLRVYLLPDGRKDEFASGVEFLPAEGALFLTSYRVIFKGTPIDPFAAEHIVTRFFPVTSVTREKRFTINEYLSEIEQQLKEGIQLRSNTFQLIRAAFDDEVSTEDVENFRRNLQRIQYPEHIFQFFAFRGVHHFVQEPLTKNKDKNAKYSTIRGFASKTLKHVTRATGYQNKKRKTSKYFLPNVMPTAGRLSIAEMSAHDLRIQEEDENGSDGSTLPLHHSLGTSSNPSKTLERLMERSYFKDWIRLGLISQDYTLTTAKSQQYHQHESFRVTTVNMRYSVTSSYPALLMVPARVTDESLKRYARCHKHSRFPTVTWKHQSNHALLLRGAGFHGRGFMGMIRRHHQDPHSGAGGGQVEMASSADAEVYVTSIIQVTPRAMMKPESAMHMTGSELSLNSLVAGGASSGSDYPAVHSYPTLTPNMARKFNPLTKAMDTLTRSTGPPKFSRLSLSNMKGNRNLGSQTSLTSGGYRGSYRYSNDAESGSELGINSFLQRTSLYIFVDKNQIKGVKLDYHPKTEIIPVDYPEPRRIRASFKKLMRACVPSSSSTQQDQTFLKLVEASEWLSFLQMILQISGAIVDLMDIQGASVSVCLEDGWDVTAQVTSLAMLCLDPYYRTIEGFRILIEKEWLGLGHRFNHRSHLSNPNQDSGFTPLFLQFLDLVHQIHSQFPMAFEFNAFYLKFLAYHHVSCRFRTFLLDNEMQRHEIGFLAYEDKQGSFPRQFRNLDAHSSDEESAFATKTSSSSSTSNIGVNVFDYIDFHVSKSPIFTNLTYCTELSMRVLRPYSHISDLRIWDYFLQEELKHGPAYDLELFHLDEQQEDEFNKDTSLTSHMQNHESVTIGYDNLSRVSLDAYSMLLYEIAQLESDLGLVPKHWQSHWEKLDLPLLSPVRDHNPIVQTTPSLTAKHHGRIVHKRSTMELILKGKIGANATSVTGDGSSHVSGSSYSHLHRFEKYNYSTPTSCEVCNSLLWGPVKTGLRCADCGYNCHDKCRENVPKACTKYKSVPRDSTTDQLDQLASSGINSSSKPRSSHNRPGDYDQSNPVLMLNGGQEEIFSQFSPTSAEENSQIICQGYLYKLANFKIKGWKQRWFLLDATKHQLRYYDTREDFHCRGYIDLSEVTRIMPGSAPPAGAPKKADDGCFFDLYTTKRIFYFSAENKQAATDWIEKIRSCLST